MQLKWNLQTNTITAAEIEQFNNRDVYAHFLVIDSTAVSADVIFATFSSGGVPITSSVPLVRTMADRFVEIYGLPSTGESRFYCPIPANVFVVGTADTVITITLTHKKARAQGGQTVYSLINSSTYDITVLGNNITADDKEALINEELIEQNIYTTLINDYNYLVGRLETAETDINALKNIVGNTPLETTAQTLTGAVNELNTAVISQESRLDVLESFEGGATADLIELENRTSELETVVGTADIQEVAPDITQAILSLNEDVDALQEGVVPRINRGIIEFANPTVIPSAELVAELNDYIFRNLYRSPNNTDKMTVRDDETPDEGTYYTYNYWKGYTQVTDGWYWDSISVSSPVNDVPSYSRNVLLTSWGSAVSGMYTITIPASTHGQGTDNKLTVEFKAANADGTYSPVQLWDIAANGDVTLYTDTPFAGIVVIKAGTATYVSQLMINEAQVIGLTGDIIELKAATTPSEYYIKTREDFIHWQQGVNLLANAADRIYLCCSVYVRDTNLSVIPYGNNIELIGIGSALDRQPKIQLEDGQDITTSGTAFIGSNARPWEKVENIGIEVEVAQTTPNIDIYGIMANSVQGCSVKISFTSAITLATLAGIVSPISAQQFGFGYKIEDNIIDIPSANITATAIYGIFALLMDTVGRIYNNRIALPYGSTINSIGIYKGVYVAFNRVAATIGYSDCEYGTCNRFHAGTTASANCTKWSTETND